MPAHVCPTRMPDAVGGRSSNGPYARQERVSGPVMSRSLSSHSQQALLAADIGDLPIYCAEAELCAATTDLRMRDDAVPGHAAPLPIIWAGVFLVSHSKTDRQVRNCAADAPATISCSTGGASGPCGASRQAQGSQARRLADRQPATTVVGSCGVDRQCRIRPRWMVSMKSARTGSARTATIPAGPETAPWRFPAYCAEALASLRVAPTRDASDAAMKSSSPPSSTASGLPFSTPVRRSFTIW